MPAKIERVDEGFEVYFALGEKRSLKKVSEGMGVSLKTVENWSKTHYWIERCELRELRSKTQVAKIAGADPLKDKGMIMKAVRGGIKSVISEDSHGNRHIRLKVNDVYQFDRLVRLYLLLSGEPTDIKAVRHETIEMIVNHVVLTLGKHVKDGDVLAKISTDLRDSNIMEVSSD